MILGNGEKSVTKSVSLMRIPYNVQATITGPDSPISQEINAYTLTISNVGDQKEFEKIF